MYSRLHLGLTVAALRDGIARLPALREIAQVNLAHPVIGKRSRSLDADETSRKQHKGSRTKRQKTSHPYSK